MNDIEVWKKIDGFDGVYEVSSHGRVKSNARTITYKDGRSYQKGEHFFSPKPKQGYPAVPLPGGVVAIHKLVATAFIGPRPEWARTVNHKDGNKNNNHYKNLEWASYADNNRHARRVRLNLQHGENCNLTKFSDDVVDAIRILWPTGRFTQAEIGSLFGVSEVHVHEIIHKKSRAKPTG